MARRTSWTMRLAPATIRKAKAAAKAIARPYATGEKRLEAHSPRKRREYGVGPDNRAYYPPAEAAKEVQFRTLADAGVVTSGKKGLGYAEREGVLNRKLDPRTARKKRTSTGGRWTLRKAGVARSKTTGRFTKRKKR